MTHKPVVAHIREVFFLPSETSLHTLISKQEKFKPLCLASAFKNLGQFPFARRDCYRAAICRNRLERHIGELAGKYSAIPGLLRRLKVEMLHAHFGPSGSFILPYARENGIPLVTSFYGYDASQLAGQKSWQRRYRELFNGGRLFLAEGEYLSRQLIRMGCPPDKIKIQRTGIPLERLPFRQRLPKKRGEKAIFIFCGRLVEKKGLLYALEAFRRLRETDTDFEFRIIGDGRLKNEVTAFIARHKMQSCTRLLGTLDYERYITEMDKADICLAPSITASNGDNEGGAPTVILEAQALGMPVVSTLHADIPNVCRRDISAVLCPERDAEKLALSLKAILAGQDAWKGMGEAGREFVSRYHDINLTIGSLEQAYASLLAENDFKK